MIRYQSHRKLFLAEFDWRIQAALDDNNCRVRMGECILLDEPGEDYSQRFPATQRRPTKDARLVIGTVIIKHKLCLSGRETDARIQNSS